MLGIADWWIQFSNDHRRGLHLAATIAWLAIFVWSSQENSAYAVPHTISAVDHPFDPDWPEIYWILAQKCMACHRAGAEITDYTSYESLLAAKFDGMHVVAPGDLEESMLWQYSVWHAGDAATVDQPQEPMMPPDKHQWLTAGQLNTVRRWIENGARLYRDGCGGGGPRPLMEIDFPSAKQCAGCHPKQFAEWSRSMHAYAQHSPVFEAFNLTLQERTGGTIGTFCTRCHTQLGTALGENGLRRNVHRSRLSMEGVTCVTCHRRPMRHYKASTRVYIEPGTLQEKCMFGPFDNSIAMEHSPHPLAKLPYIKSSQFCGECHDVNIPSGIRLEEAFSEWQNSPAARDGITCQLCHMGPIQGVPVPEDARPIGAVATIAGVDPRSMPQRHLTDHTFAGPDYSLLPDTEFPHKLDWMYETDYRNTAGLTKYQRETLDELRRWNRRELKLAAAKRYELLGNAARLDVVHPSTVQAGRWMKVRASVTSKFAGHSFPTGFTAERQAWISIELRDPNGNVVFVSGDLDDNGDLRDDHSHAVLTGDAAFDKYLFNLQSKFVALTNKGTERSVVLSVNRHLQPLNVIRPAEFVAMSYGRPADFRIAKSSLPPLRSMGQTYPIRLPLCPGEYTLSARLNYRHLPPTLLDHIGIPHLKHLLEVVVIDEHWAKIRVD